MYLKKVPQFFQYLYPKAIWNSTKRPQLKLTFDDGPNPESTPQLLKLLAEFKLIATFFCLGEKVKQHPGLYNEIKGAGHLTGNHGFRHISGWSTNTKNYLDNYRRAAEFIDSDLYRPPYGRITRTQINLLIEEHGQEIVMWDRMPGDFDNSVTNEQIIKCLNTTRGKDSIIVLHDTAESWSRVKESLSRSYFGRKRIPLTAELSSSQITCN